MKERPILFAAPMIRALLAGAKTQTRRIMTPQPPAGWFAVSPEETRDPGDASATPRWLVDRCPHGKPGDRLWVKETIRRVAPGGQGCSIFGADDHPTVIDAWPWQRDVLPAIFTPRGASRITLEITEVRVQRLQEIGDSDARDEGAAHRIAPGGDLHGVFADVPGSIGFVAHFRDLWDRINGDRAPWSSNPWLWAITFRVLP